MDTKELSKQEIFLRKHKPLSMTEVRQKEIDADASRKKYEKDIVKVEEYLVEYLNREDPLIDPVSDRAIAWLRRLPYKQLRELIPADMYQAYKEAEQSGDLTNFTEKITDDYEDYTFELMEKMISKPSKTAEGWKEAANPHFIELFIARIVETSVRMEEQISFF